MNTESYLAKNLALSMTDAYWICPERTKISYEEVKLRSLGLYNGGKMPYHNATFYDPNASLGGQMEKYWDLDHETPMLVKESYKYYGQQSANEVFATYLHQLQNTKIPFVRYHAEITEDHGILCKCLAFTSDKVELISAYEVIESSKKQNDMALFDSYIEISASHGISKDEMQAFMDYMILTDFVISNTDEHLMNFGVLRDADTMELLGPAPIFDSGNSMFFSKSKKDPYTRVGILEREITSFYRSEEKMLQKVKDKQIVHVDLLPHRNDLVAFYEKVGISEWKVDVISKNYETKVQMLDEFQHGRKISLYQERQKEKMAVQPAKKGIFIMLCGLPGSGKTEMAFQVCQELEKKGYAFKDARPLYSVASAEKDMEPFFKKKEILEKLTPDVTYKNSVVMISANAIREELHGKYYTDDLVFLLTDARIKKAILSGAAVIYDASNLDRDRREYYAELVGKNVEKTLVVMKTSPEQSNAAVPQERIQLLYERFCNNAPSYSEGWDKLVEYVPEYARTAKEFGLER